MSKTKTVILNHQEIEHKIRRMAYQVYERNSDESEIVLAGIMSSGYKLAEKIKGILTEISDIDVRLCQLKIDKKNPLNPIECSLEKSDFENKVVVLADDVLNSGSTLIYGANFFLEVALKKLQTLVLVDRSHKRYPISADIKGIYLSTSLNETVKVTFGTENKAEVY